MPNRLILLCVLVLSGCSRTVTSISKTPLPPISRIQAISSPKPTAILSTRLSFNAEETMWIAAANDCLDATHIDPNAFQNLGDVLKATEKLRRATYKYNHLLISPRVREKFALIDLYLSKGIVEEESGIGVLEGMLKSRMAFSKEKILGFAEPHFSSAKISLDQAKHQLEEITRKTV